VLRARPSGFGGLGDVSSGWIPGRVSILSAYPRLNRLTNGSARRCPFWPDRSAARRARCFRLRQLLPYGLSTSERELCSSVHDCTEARLGNRQAGLTEPRQCVPPSRTGAKGLDQTGPG
jgi:hypothetical protein